VSGRSKLLFLLLMLAQAAHSVEEYVTRLFEVFTPARVVSGLIADNPAVGFAAFNAAVILIGAWCYLGPVRAGSRAAWIVAVVWLVIELANGTVHLAIAAFTGAYFSGAFTAVLLVVTTVCLALSLIRDRMGSGHDAPLRARPAVL
jgi:Protein of unknown function with HXXEE motif